MIRWSRGGRRKINIFHEFILRKRMKTTKSKKKKEVQEKKYKKILENKHGVKKSLFFKKEIKRSFQLFT